MSQIVQRSPKLCPFEAATGWRAAAAAEAGNSVGRCRVGVCELHRLPMLPLLAGMDSRTTRILSLYKLRRRVPELTVPPELGSDF